jgi:hypothetical protein
METSTTISEMMHGNNIFVPDYQRAYSWDTNVNKKQVNVFLSDLEDHIISGVDTPYYFGHFLYEKIQNTQTQYAIIDGQQRLTTITIFLCALFNSIKMSRPLSDKEINLYENLIKSGSSYKFSTVRYDDQLFRDYVVDTIKMDHYNIKTTSGNRIVQAYDYLKTKVKDMKSCHVEALISTVTQSTCTTHIVKGEAEAIQMFIFQNNRGKKPSQLEVIKAQFMYTVHIYSDIEDKNAFINEIKIRFENIYSSISVIEDFIDEDDVLSYALRVYFNSLWESNSIERISTELDKKSRLDFIRNFSISLEKSFNNLSRLYSDKNKDVNIEASLLCGHYNILLPFFIKAYSNGIEMNEISRMAKAIGDLLLRDNIIKTRADLRSRLENVFKGFHNSVDEIVNLIERMKTETSWWWAYWNNDSLKHILDSNWSPSYHSDAKIILWKYENYLISEEGKNGYSPIRYDSITNPHLEHIAPQTENGEKEAAGYDVYDNEFREKYMFCIGNFLLLSAPHNESIGNKPFELKRNTYNQLKQQREIQIMTESDHKWNREKIATRKEKLVKFILEQL